MNGLEQLRSREQVEHLRQTTLEKTHAETAHEAVATLEPAVTQDAS